MDAEVAALWKEVSTKAHVRGQTAARRNAAPQAAPREENTTGTKLRFVGHPVGDKWCLVEGDVSSTSDGSYLITTRPGLCV